MAYPILAAQKAWYKGTTARSTITQINIVDSYTVTGSENESWNADVNNSGAIKCYRTGTVLTIAGNGSGKIAMNADSKSIFAQYTNLVSINGLSLFDASGVTNLQAAFDRSSKITSLDIGGWNVSNVTNMSGVFQGCISLNSVDLSNWDVGNVTTMQGMFQSLATFGNMVLTSIGDVSNWNTSKVTTMAYMFQYNPSLTTLQVSNWDVGNVTNMNSMFYKCASLTELDVGEWNVSKVTNMMYMFRECTSLTKLDVSKWDVSKVTNMRCMFAQGDYGNPHNPITELDVSNWDVSSCTDMGWMFYASKALKHLDVSKWDTSNVTVMHHLFGHCNSLVAKGVENWNVSKVRAFNAMFHQNAHTRLDLSKWDVSNGETFSQMFEGNQNLVELKGLDKWNTSKGKDFGEMFFNCAVLKELDISGLDTRNASTSYTDEWNEQIGNMTNMFGNMPRLQKITIGENFSFNGDGTCAAVLPTPDSTYIDSADGNWYNSSGKVFAPAEVAEADTYLASQTVLEEFWNVPVLVKYGTLVHIANALRDVTESETKYLPSDIPSAIYAVKDMYTS